MAESWDAFVSHASEDKESFVLPLASLLREAGFDIWLDTWCLQLGASLSMSVEDGLRRSRFAIVILSPAYFAKRWPRAELGAMVAAQNTSARVILPVWYHVDADKVRHEAPLMADRVAVNGDEGLAAVADKLTRELRIGRLSSTTNTGGSDPITPDSIARLTIRRYPEKGIDEFWQARLLADLDTVTFRSIDDLERALERARPAVETYAAEQPGLFTKGTDYITKSLGFVDLCFRSRHNFGTRTREAFEKFAAKVDWSHS